MAFWVNFATKLRWACCSKTVTWHFQVFASYHAWLMKIASQVAGKGASRVQLARLPPRRLTKTVGRKQQSRQGVIARLSHGTPASTAACHMPDPRPTTEPHTANAPRLSLA